ncbi:MAG: hypothetical protein IT383_17760 [Deltaproteobacteria bacterium]|nr:hypothetical protein [Deltaproteobacteria bacterium]
MGLSLLAPSPARAPAPWPLAALCLVALACAERATAPAPALSVRAERDLLEANGVDSTRIVASLPRGTQGVVVSFSSSGGMLSSSAAIPDADGTAAVTLSADTEEALLGRPDKPVTVRATVRWDANREDTATTDLSFVTPTSGAPALHLSTDPPAALADGAALVTLTLGARRLPAGTEVALSTSAGALSAERVVVHDDGAGGSTATFTLQAPAAPAEATVTAREPSGVMASAVVRFVADGDAQFDLTGTFAQLSPARIRMSAGTLTPNPQCVVAPAIIRVQLTQEGERVVADWQTCFVTLAPVRSIVGEVTTTAPPAFTSSIPVVHAELALSGVALGAVFDPPPSVVVAGAELAHPEDDALPTSEDDERVRDADGDGKPGVTVINSVGGEQNITFRNRGDTRGLVMSSNRIVGEQVGDLSALPESSVLGVGNGFLPEFQSVPSVFEMVRVDGHDGAPDLDTNGDGTVDCAEIVDAQGFIFTIAAPSTPLDCAGVP